MATPQLPLNPQVLNRGNSGCRQLFGDLSSMDKLAGGEWRKLGQIFGGGIDAVNAV